MNRRPKPSAGIRYRTETRARRVPHTIDGVTEMVEDTYTVHVRIPPRDWDQIVLNAVTVAAVLLVAASVVWSTASIGDLLALAVVAAVSYLAAAVFDLAWISCMALEWLARYDEEKARGPRRAGHVALVVAMAAVCVHGWMKDSFVVGAVGAAVSALAKGMWTIVLKHHARPLDERTRQWLVQREAEIGAQLTLAARLRQLNRIKAQHAALLAATQPGPDASSAPDTSGQGTGGNIRADGTVRSAVRAAAATLPDSSPEAIVDHLSADGIDTDENVVRTVLDSMPDTTDSRSQRNVRPIGARGQTLTDTVRTAVSSGITDEDAVVRYAQSIHGDKVNRSSVARILRREKAG